MHLTWTVFPWADGNATTNDEDASNLEDKYDDVRANAEEVLAAALKSTRKMAWRKFADWPRLCAVIWHLKEEFLNRNAPDSREDIDRGDTHQFWTMAANVFNNKEFTFELVKCDEHSDVMDLSTDYTGYVATAMDLKKRFNAMRAILDVNLVKFKASGNGDGKLDPAVEAGLINDNKYPKAISNMEFK